MSARRSELITTSLGSPLEWLPTPACDRRIFADVIVNSLAGPDEDHSFFDRLKAAGPFLASNS